MELLIPIVLVGVMWFFMSRSTKKQQQERQNTLNAMKAGDDVITIGGLHGVLSEVNDKTVVLDCEGIYLEFEKSAVKTVKPGTTAVTDTVQTEIVPEATVEKTEAAEEDTTENDKD